MQTNGLSFKLTECLGRGGFGEVYRASVSSYGGIDRTVAVKILRSDLAIGSDAVARLRDEARVLARLNHPNIIKVQELTLLEGRVALVMEYLEGEDLSDCLTGPSPLPLVVALDALMQVAHALEAAWDATGRDGQPLHLVHRDIKPTNIRIGRHGEVKLLDFGIARAQNLERESETSSSLVVGSLSYMAPERFVSRVPMQESDVFGLGCILYEIVSGGERLYGPADLRRITTLALDPMAYGAFLDARIAGRTPVAELEELLRRTLAYQPSARPSVRSFADALAELRSTRLESSASVREWARSRHWSDAQASWGPLAGRVLRQGAAGPAEGIGQRGREGYREVPVGEVETTWEMVEAGARPLHLDVLIVVVIGASAGMLLVVGLAVILLGLWLS